LPDPASRSSTTDRSTSGTATTKSICSWRAGAKGLIRRYSAAWASARRWWTWVDRSRRASLSPISSTSSSAQMRAARRPNRPPRCLSQIPVGRLFGLESVGLICSVRMRT